MQQNQEYESEDEEKIIVVGFVGVGPIYLGSDSGDEMNIVALGIAEDGPVDLGFDSSDERNISAYILLKVRREPKVSWLQEFEEINQSIQAENNELRRLLQEAQEEKQRLQHQLQAKEEALETLQHNKPEVKNDSSISCSFMMRISLLLRNIPHELDQNY